MKLHLQKMPNGVLAPADAQSVEALAKYKTGDVLGGEFKKTRNYAFHKKWFALVGYAFEAWEPAEGMPEKNFERFRHDVTIAAGFYDLVPCINGELKAEAKSLSFAKMSEDDFSLLYDATINALLKFVLRNYTREDVDRVMDEIARFAA